MIKDKRIENCKFKDKFVKIQAIVVAYIYRKCVMGATDFVLYKKDYYWSLQVKKSNETIHLNFIQGEEY